jgi:hypothetical protein
MIRDAFKFDLQTDIFRAHEQARADDVRRRRVNRIFCQHLDRVEETERELMTLRDKDLSDFMLDD